MANFISCLLEEERGQDEYLMGTETKEKRKGLNRKKLSTKTIIFLYIDRPSILPSSLSIYLSFSLQVSFNNRVPGERLNSTV